MNSSTEVAKSKGDLDIIIEAIDEIEEIEELEENRLFHLNPLFPLILQLWYNNRMFPMLSIEGVLITALIVVCAILLLVVHEERKLRELVQKEREKNLVFALIFHQLDDMITSVKWHSELMMSQEFGKLTLTQAELINKMNMSAADAVMLLKKYLVVSGKEFDLTRIQSEGLDLHDFLENLVQDLSSKKAKNIG